MVLVKKWPFFQLFCLANIGQENVFYDILKRKKAFLGYKNKKVKKSKNWDFSKRVNSWFWSKNCNFSSFLFFRQYSPENMFNDILEPKNHIVRHKNKTFKQSKNGDFSKGVNSWFWSKNGHFSNFFFRQYRPGKGLLQYWRTKKRLSRLQKQDLQKVKKLTFFQRG